MCDVGFVLSGSTCVPVLTAAPLNTSNSTPLPFNPQLLPLPFQWLGSLLTRTHNRAGVGVGPRLCLPWAGSIVTLSVPFDGTTFYLLGTCTYSMVGRSMWPLEMVLEKKTVARTPP